VDRELVRRTQQGDLVAFGELAREVSPRLFRVAYRIVRDSDVAQDAMQQVLISIWRDLPTLRDVDAFEGWMWRLVANAATTEIRRDHRHAGSIRVLRLEPVAADAAWATADSSHSVAERDAIEHAFTRLTPEQRVVVVLRFYVGLPLDEIARAIDVPYGTAASRIHYAMRALRAALELDEGRAEVRTS